jgi:tetratricopeptide (TPR) repeat protein
MSEIPDLAKQAMEKARQGDLGKALALATQALAERPGDAGLMLLVGNLHSRRMELPEAAAKFRDALAIVPGEPLARAELARALIGLGEVDEAEQVIADAPLPGASEKRLQAMIAMRRGDYPGAAKLSEQLTATDPRDFEAWGNLGICRLRCGDSAAAVEALNRALALRPNHQPFREQWVEANVAAGTGEKALEHLRTTAANARTCVTIARLEELLGRPEKALEALDEALAIDGEDAAALLALARLSERQNRLDESAAAIRRLEGLATPAPELPVLKAQLAFRRGDFEEALELASAAPASDAGSRAELLGKIHDRLGHPAEAFAAFAEMNRDTGLSGEVAESKARSFRDRLTANAKILEQQPAGDVAQAPATASPAFVLSFPRSGTTLLDTLLMGHPALCIAEEKPMLDSVAQHVGSHDRLPELHSQRLEQLRNLYFAEAAAHVAACEGRQLVDKQPFATVEVPLIDRLFPSAPLVFVERHPCDVVLSCFMTRFEPNAALLNFTTLEGTARLYASIMNFWTSCRERLPLNVHRLRYEQMVADPEGAMRALLPFLGVEWDERVLDHSATAAGRGFINTPSYSQVIEPLYDRSIGRWKRYREQMKPVLPLLEPWVEALGYEM